MACQSHSEAQKAAAGPPPPLVAVMTVSAEDVPIYNEYAAQTDARQMVEVRGRVDGYYGYIEKRLKRYCAARSFRAAALRQANPRWNDCQMRFARHGFPNVDAGVKRPRKRRFCS